MPTRGEQGAEGGSRPTDARQLCEWCGVAARTPYGVPFWFGLSYSGVTENKRVFHKLQYTKALYSPFPRRHLPLSFFVFLFSTNVFSLSQYPRIASGRTTPLSPPNPCARAFAFGCNRKQKGDCKSRYSKASYLLFPRKNLLHP